MTIKADHWINHNGTWYGPGQEYEADESAKAEEAVETETDPEPEEKKTRRPRKPKAE